MIRTTPSTQPQNERAWRLRKLLVTVVVTLAITVGIGSTPGQARATDGSFSTVSCPAYKPYVRVNAFGIAYCSVYP